MTIVPIYFNDKRSLAVGVSTCGSGLAAIILPLLVRKLLKSASWRSVLRIQAACITVGILLGAIYRPMSMENKPKKEGIPGGKLCATLNSIFSVSLFSCAVFRILVIMVFLDFMAVLVPMLFLNDLAQEQGLDKSQAALLVIIEGVAFTVTTVGVGQMLVQWPRLQPLVVLGVGQIIGGAATIPLATIYTTFQSLASYATCLGIVYGTLSTLL